MNPEQTPVSGNDFEGELEALDEQLKRLFPAVDAENVLDIGPLILCYVVKKSKGRLNQKYKDINAASELIKKHETLRNLIIEGPKDSFKPVLRSKLLQAETTEITEKYVSSIEKGWDSPFVGDAAGTLWDHISHVFTKADEEAHVGDTGTSANTMASAYARQEYYARYCALLQSSGMGKSRTVDELGKKHYVIPVVLREPGTTGHPPSDQPAYWYLSKSSTHKDAFLRSCGFLHALFLEVAAVLKNLGGSATPGSFRDYMREDMKFKCHGTARTKFYEKVVGAAERHKQKLYIPYFEPCDDPSSPLTDACLGRKRFPLRKAFDVLLSAIENIPMSESKAQKRARTLGPRVIVAFDEIYTLTVKSEGESWTRFNELRRAIRGLRYQDFFSLFLSTSGAAFAITPTPARDPSTRMAMGGNVMLPFCELGFDHLAALEDFSRPIPLSRVASLEHLVSYGRPLWKSWYNGGEWADEIIRFAVSKLLGGTSNPLNLSLSIPQQLACLAQRIPIEFLSTTYTSRVSSDYEKEQGQVHSHLRVLLKVENDIEIMVTTTPSEPILSEAAYFLMTSPACSFSPAQTLQNILDGFAVNKGELGELLVALLFIMARDTAVGPADEYGQPPCDRRWCSVPTLLSTLFRSSGSVLDISGWRFSRNTVKPNEKPLAGVFKNSKVYFTHFIKAQEQKIVRTKYLMRLMARGAALLCAPGQTGVDGIIPFLLNGNEIRPDKIGVIMFQVKNDKKFTNTPQPKLVRNMNPGTLLDLSNIPVIRVVFALAATQPALTSVPHKYPGDTAKSYTAYDFWAAGFSSRVFPQLRKEEPTWQSILQVSRRWENVYQSDLKGSKQLRMMMNPGVASADEHWKKWCKE